MSVIILNTYARYSGIVLTDITSVYTNRIFQLSIKDQLGTSSYILKYKAFLLTAYYQILSDYLNPVDLEDTNFFNTYQIKDILNIFNELANSSIYSTFENEIDIPQLPETLFEKFIYLWTDQYSGNNLLSDLDDTIITVTDKDWGTNIIPTTSATFTGTTPISTADSFWSTSKTFTELIESTSLRTFVKYNETPPYYISAIGVLKASAILTEQDKSELTDYFRLWVQYWSNIMAENGYMKENRVLIED